MNNIDVMLEALILLCILFGGAWILIGLFRAVI